ncbi:MAG: PqqD family protein [Anaerolineaceae bacterium]|nr:PqqD family protein [Anaerolineaceae bacterium]
MDLQSVVVVAQNQVSTGLEGEVVILNLQSGVYFGLKGVGARIWELIKDPVKASDISDAILVEFSVDRERCEQDVLAILENLKSSGLIEVKNEAAG